MVHHVWSIALPSPSTNGHLYGAQVDLQGAPPGWGHFVSVRIECWSPALSARADTRPKRLAADATAAGPSGSAGHQSVAARSQIGFVPVD